MMNVDRFKQNFDGASRPNRFAVLGEIGAGGGNINNIVVRAASMPSVTVGMIRVPFRGRIVKIPGDRTYEEWTFTVYDGFKAGVEFRDKFLKWNTQLNDHELNTPIGTFAGNPVGGGIDMMDQDTFTEWSVHQLDLLGQPVRSVVLKNCWPTVVSELALNYDNSDQLAEFSVTLAYDWYEDFGTNVSPMSAGLVI
jgi:hypothetical protein